MIIRKNDTYVNFTFREFKSHQAIMDYILDDDYMLSDSNPGICFGFSVTENKTDNIEIKMAFSATGEDISRQAIPDQSNPAWSPKRINNDIFSFQAYARFGYSQIHNWIANSVLRSKLQDNSSHIAVTLIPFKSDPQKYDDY